jgi:hypothetical protein
MQVSNILEKKIKNTSIVQIAGFECDLRSANQNFPMLAFSSILVSMIKKTNWVKENAVQVNMRCLLNKEYFQELRAKL